jgi:hypothetical protein
VIYWYKTAKIVLGGRLRYSVKGSTAGESTGRILPLSLCEDSPDAERGRSASNDIIEDCGSHMRIVRSSEQDAKTLASTGCQTTEFTLPRPCPSSTSKSTPESLCHIYTFAS